MSKVSTLMELIKGAKKTVSRSSRLFRVEADPVALKRTGFNPLLSDGENWSASKPEGLYWADKPTDISRIYSLDEDLERPLRGSDVRGLVESITDNDYSGSGAVASLLGGRMVPDAVVRQTSEEALGRLSRRAKRAGLSSSEHKAALTDSLRHKIDFLRINGIDGDSLKKELIQLNPGKVRLSTGELIGVGGALAASILGTPEDSEAALHPEIRKLLEVAKKYVPKDAPEQLYHFGSRAPEVLKRDIDPNMIKGQGEYWKPAALYWTDKVLNIPGHLTNDWQTMKDTPLKRFKMLMGMRYENGKKTMGSDFTDWSSGKPKVNLPIIRGTINPEAEITRIPEDALRGMYNPLSQEVAATEAPTFEAVKDYLSKGFSEKTDILNIRGADMQKGVNEYLQLNPDHVNMFLHDMARTPSKGLIKAIEAPIDGLLNKDPQYAKAKAANLAKQKGSKASSYEPKPMNAEQASEFFDEYISPDDPLFKMFKKSGEAYDPNFPKIAAALTGGGIAGAVLGMPDQSEAMPIGKLQPTPFAGIKNTIRSESTFKTLLGRKIPLAFKGEQNHYEVVDVLKNSKGNDWRYVVVKDENGKRFHLPMTKDYLQILTQSSGTGKYIEKFERNGLVDKHLQANKSIDIREAKGGAVKGEVRNFKAWNSGQALKAEQISPELNRNYVYGRTAPDQPLIYVPAEYATFLQSKGRFTIESPAKTNRSTVDISKTLKKRDRTKQPTADDLDAIARKMEPVSNPFSKYIKSLKDQFK